MSVANESAATGIVGFLQRLYKPIYVWAKESFATKEEVAAIETADVSDVSQQTANAVFGDYTFTTTD